MGESDSPPLLTKAHKNTMLKESLLRFENRHLKADNRQLEAEVRQLNQTIAQLKFDLANLRSTQLTRQADFLDVALKTLVQNGTITINDDRDLSHV